MSKDNSYFFCGIGGSGMQPLATILAEQGAKVAGSDRALDQGRLAAKFESLQDKGMTLFAQDGSGLTSEGQILVASAAVEDSVPDVKRANQLGCARMTRAELLAQLFNGCRGSVAIGGTSGKSTVTGMIGWIASEAGLDPTIMNGAVMKNFVGEGAPFASSRVGEGRLFISEVDESDGSIALFRPEVAILNNISLDHKSLEELRQLFGDFAGAAKCAVFNIDDDETRLLMAGLTLPAAVSFGMEEGADFRATHVVEAPHSIRFNLVARGQSWQVGLQVPGKHNVMNALAALAAADALGIALADSVPAIEGFTGLARRFDIVGSANDITVIDDFGHNPDKIAATLSTMRVFPGRIIAFFQPHGYGPLKVMGNQLAHVFAEQLAPDDRVILCDPVYFGGTADRSVGSESVVAEINDTGGMAVHIAAREDCGTAITEMAQPGDRIVIMGARDDTLRSFAADILARLDMAKASA
ncbi:MAG: Mur ligase family protein [Sphingorhabdus sp.]